jgi:hypothetical protein
MKKIELTADQKEALETRHKKSCGKRESDRIKAVYCAMRTGQHQ